MQTTMMMTDTRPAVHTTNVNTDDVILMEDLQSSHAADRIGPGFTTLLFCTGGNVELDIDDMHYRMGANDVICCNCGTSLRHASRTPEYNGKLLCVSWEYTSRLLMHGACSPENMLHTRRHPLLHLQPDEQRLFEAYYRLLAVKAGSGGRAVLEDADSILLSFFQDFYRVLAGHAGRHGVCRVPDCASGRRDEIFKRFIILLKENFRQEHRITFYADRLRITPKHLSAVVRKVSGHGASKWIEVCLTDEIKSLLRDSNMEIKEMAWQLGFSTPSFFGKFVKDRTGMSPQGLRKSLRAV